VTPPGVYEYNVAECNITEDFRIIIFRTRHSQAKCILAMAVCLSVCVCVSVRRRIPTSLHHCTYPEVTVGNDSGCPVIVRYWAYLQSVHGFRCYDNIHYVYDTIGRRCNANQTWPWVGSIHGLGCAGSKIFIITVGWVGSRSPQHAYSANVERSNC